MTGRLQRFDFGSLRDFRGPLELPAEIVAPLDDVVAEPPPPPTYLQEELDAASHAAREQGYAEGYQAGLAYAEAQITHTQRTTQRIVGSLGAALAQARQDYQALLDYQALELGQLVLHIAKKVTGTMLEGASAGAVVALVQQCLPILLSKPTVTIELHPEDLISTMDAVEKMLQQAGVEAQVEFRANAALGPSDATLDWTTGQATRNVEVLWQEVESLLANTVFHARPPMTESPVPTHHTPGEPL